MSNDDTRIADGSTAALLAALANVPRSVPTLAEYWCKLVGLQPGTCRVPASALYREWRDWWRNQADYMDYGAAGLAAWGRYMAAHYRRGRGKHGKFYYVARKAGG